MLLQDKVAVITGAGQGIGRAIALAYAREGAKLVLASRTEHTLEETRKLIQGLGREALVVPTDIRTEESVQILSETSLKHFGHIDILVNNSGIAGPTASLWEITLQQWQETLAVNLTGTFLCCRAFLPHMIERHAGSIIMISSGIGKNPLAGRTPYAASKIALVGMARTLAWETGPYGIRVNVISPGTVEGERVESVLQKQAEKRKVSIDAVRQTIVSRAALGRFTAADDIAHAAVFLASDQANSITGEDINVSAGLVMH